jgi:glycosyltransferase involved in cell wall biosynthesis
MKNEKIRILQIINSARRGGGTRHLYDLVTGLPKTDYEFHIAISPDGPYTETFRDAGFKVYEIDMMSGRFQSRAVKSIARLILELKPMLIHAHGTRAAFFFARGRDKTADYPFIYTAHGLSYNKNSGLWIRVFNRQVERYICSKADKIISVSPTDSKEMVENEIVSRKKLKTIPNGIDLSRFLKLKSKNKNRQVLGCVARLTEQKGIKYLIEALSILKYVYNSETRAVIVGDGPLSAKLKTLAGKYSVEDRIEWIGAVDDPIEYYKKFDIFVLPSLWEGLPLVLIEAMASGVPVISTDTSGGLDIVKDHRNGLLVPRGSGEALAIAINELNEKPALAKKIGASARAETEKKYSLKLFLNRTDSFYRETVKEKKRKQG